jgi:prepilin-type N-terminal cleavage/methylation domain-containing protein
MESHPARRRAGFTLIELLVVVVVIGVLASIVAPRFAAAKGKSYAAAAASDLHSLALAQENHFAGTQTYTTSLETLRTVVSPGVTIRVVEATGSGWSATATHSSGAVTCAIYLGDATPVRPATSEGATACGR